MTFNKHSELAGAHAFLSPSKYHWLGYDADKLRDSYLNSLAVQRGTELHAFAEDCIRLGIKLPDERKTLNMYVNDAIGFKMTPEQPLVYSMNCFGTADSICFRKNLLRIHDLKTGQTPADIRQLLIYNSLWCLEYGKKPDKVKSILRIYQNDDIFEYEPDKAEVQETMEKIVWANKILEGMQQEEK